MRSEPAMRATLVRPATILAALPLVAALAGIGVLYRDTFVSLVIVWLESATFAHCFLVAPVTLYLIWQRRDELTCVQRRVSWKGVLAVLALSAVWLVAASANVQLGQQAMVVLMIPACVLALYGEDFTRRLAFPLGYLMLAVPFGDWLVQPLMNFTADFAVAALRLTGIPVLREGVYFSIPSGDFEVAKGCSGIRYLIACFAIGMLYMHFAYRSWGRRLLFIALSLVVPIVGNGIRAYLIVMIAHLSDMRLAVGVDHIIYGAIFFGVIVALMLWIGNLFSEAPQAATQPAHAAAAQPRNWGLRMTTAGAVVIAAAVGPLVGSAMQSASPPVTAVQLPRADDTWRGPIASAAPIWEVAGTEVALDLVRGAYTTPTVTVEIAVLRGGREPSDREVVGSLPLLIDTQRWQILETHSARNDGGDGVREMELRARRDYAVLWYWYLVGGTHASAEWHAKALEAWSTLTTGRADAAMVVIAARAPDGADARRAVEDAFDRYAAAIARCIVGASSPECAPPAE